MEPTNEQYPLNGPIHTPAARSGTEGLKLTVRPFRDEDDARAIRRICISHFRSLCFPAVKYYCFEHFRDLIALLIIGGLFVNRRQMACQVILFVIYLIVRARIELELYIYRSCPDLLDVPSHYMKGPSNRRSCFWVAEVERSGDDPAGVKKEVVGCVGLRPARDNPLVAQLLRLVVAEDARRMRFGSRLLAQFERTAREFGYKEVRLYTNNLSTHHIRFIAHHGYSVVHCISRALMRGALIQWRKDLTPTDEEPSGSATNDAIASQQQQNTQSSPGQADSFLQWNPDSQLPHKAKVIAGLCPSGSSSVGLTKMMS